MIVGFLKVYARNIARKRVLAVVGGTDSSNVDKTLLSRSTA